MGSNYISLYNENTGEFDQLTVDELDVGTISIDTATINNATITTLTTTTANITGETVNNSTINNLTIGNVLYFPDGTQLFPSIAFANEIRTGIYRYGTNQIGLVTNGILRALITNSGLISVFNIQTGGQFLSNTSSVSVPSYSFVGDPTTGLYESAGGEVSIASSGSQVISFNNSLITSLVNLLVPNITISGQLKNSVLYLDNSKNLRSIQLTNGQLLIGSNGTIPTATTLTGTTNQINITNGAGSITLSTPQNIATTSTPTFASMSLTNTTNQLVLGTTNTTTISANPPGASRTYTIPDVFTTAATEFVMSQGIQTIPGAKTFSGSVFLTGLVANGMLSLTNTGLVNSNLLSNGQIFIGRTGNSPLNTTITGTANQIIVTNGSGSITLSAPQNIDNTASPTFAGLTINGNINAGTYAMTCGALSSTSITNTGNFNNGTNAATVGALTTTTINAGTNSVTCGSLICSTFNPASGAECVLTTAGSASGAWHAGLRVDSGTTTNANYYGYTLIKNGSNALYMGVNSNATVGQIPANGVYISNYGSTLPGIYIGRGGNNQNISFADIGIDVNGAITTMNNILVTRTCTSSQSINTTAPTTFTTWDTSITNQGNTTYSTGVWTIGTAGVYQCSYDVCWAANSSGYRQCYINATAGAFAHSTITSPGSIVFPQSGSAPIKCAIGDSINLLVYQSTGGALNIAPSGNFQVRFSIVKTQ